MSCGKQFTDILNCPESRWLGPLAQVPMSEELFTPEEALEPAPTHLHHIVLDVAVLVPIEHAE